MSTGTQAPIAKEIVTQILALIAFFAFPAIQYALLKIAVRREGKPELWYLPKYGFRLVIRNLPRKKVLSEIKFRAVIRKREPSGDGASVATYQDKIIVDGDDFFVFPGMDAIILSFRLEGEGSDIKFIPTDKLGKGDTGYSLSDFDYLISYYVATVENILNFDIKIAKQAEIKSSTLQNAWKDIQIRDREGRIEVDRIRDVG